MKLKKEVRIGLVAVVAVAFLIFGINYLRGRNIFKKGREFYAVFHETFGLVPASPVQYNGIKVGQVSDIQLVEIKEGVYRNLVTINVDNKILNFPKDSYAKLASADLLGTKAIIIIPGGMSVNAEEGDTLIAEQDPSLQERIDAEIAPIVRKAEGIMGKLDTIMLGVSGVLGENAEDLTSSIESFKLSLHNFKTFTDRLNSFMDAETGKISMTLTKFESIASNIEKNNQNIDKILNNFAAISDTLSQAELASTVNNLNTSIENLNGILKTVNSGEGSLGALIYTDSLHNALLKTNQELNVLIKNITDNPNKYIHFSVFGRKN